MRHRIDQLLLAFAGAASGVTLYQALFPAFYYMSGYGWMLWFFLAISAALLIAGLLRWLLYRPTNRSEAPLSTGFVLILMAVVTGLVAFRVPLRASFLLARPGLEEALAVHSSDLTQVAYTSRSYGIYQIRGARRRCHDQTRVYFEFLDDAESAIVHSPSGIDDLCYNAGAKGPLFDDWYWIKED